MLLKFYPMHALGTTLHWYMYVVSISIFWGLCCSKDKTNFSFCVNTFCFFLESVTFTGGTLFLVHLVGYSTPMHVSTYVWNSIILYLFRGRGGGEKEMFWWLKSKHQKRSVALQLCIIVTTMYVFTHVFHLHVQCIRTAAYTFTC